MTRLQSLLENSVRQYPEKTAIQFEGKRISYGELHYQVRQVAAGLQNMGIEQGDRVAWFLPNCLEAVVTTLACYQIGAVSVPLNYRYVAEEANDIIQRIDARMILIHTDKTQVVEPVLQTRKEIIAVSVGSSQNMQGNIQPFSALLSSDELKATIDIEPNSPALILFTSGSTGHPKGVVHSHDGAFAGIETSRQVFDFTAEDVVLVGKPISHAGGLQTQLMPALSVGARVVLTMRPIPAMAVSLINEESVTEYGMLASDLLDFVEYLENNPTELPTLNNSIGSGDAVPTDLHHRFRDLLGWEVMEGAGITEIGGYYAANPRFGKRKWGSLGLPTPDTDLRIITPDGDDCPSGETGEIVIRTPSATIGYWHDEQATTELLRGDWLHTGDLGHFDDDGYVWFVGRKKLMIVRRGSNIAPAEVESIIDEHPLVHAAVVVGLRDPRDGEVPVACVALIEKQNDSSEVAIRAYVADELASYKNPAHYMFFDELPRTSTGKFDRHQLQELATKKFGG